MSQNRNFDDRIDTQTDLSAGQTLGLIGRSLKLLGDVRALYCCKIVFGLVSLLPALVLPWILKIVVDQVILQKPVTTTDAKFPPFMMPFLNIIDGLHPNEIMLAITALLIVMLLLFGMRSGPSEQVAQAGMVQGYDAATQSEQALSAGGSSGNGLWGLIETLLSIRMTQRLANGLRVHLMERLTHLNMTALDDQRIGDSVYRVMYDAPMVPEICYRVTLEPLFLIVGTGLTVYLMQYSYGEVSPELVWIAAAIVPVTLILTAPLSGIARRVHQASRAAGAATTNSMEEGIDNIAAVQSLGGIAKETEKFSDKSQESYRRFRHTALISAVVTLISYIITMVAMIWVFILITDEVLQGILSPGDYAVIWGLFIVLSQKSRILGTYWIELQRNIAAVRRVFFFIDYTSELDSRNDNLAEIKRGIFLDNVSFAYPNGHQVLQNINLELPLGELVAIVGPTGSGKTTLAYLLPGYLRPSKGIVRFDQQDIFSVKVDDIRNQVSYVFQEHMLLSTTIRDNLMLSKPDATEAELVHACEISGAMAFIEALPEGLDTVVGRSGDTLSVGQKQRLSIARGLLRNTPVIILDEPTAALDPQTENALMASLIKVAKSRLVIVIAHRLSTIKKADRIVFLEEGQVLDIGTHESLMADRDSRYYHFVTLQNK